MNIINTGKVQVQLIEIHLFCKNIFLQLSDFKQRSVFKPYAMFLKIHTALINTDKALDNEKKVHYAGFLVHVLLYNCRYYVLVSNFYY